MAGLNGFCPRPPYSCLAITMAKKVPMTIIHQGASGGRLMPSNRAVSRAELSASRVRTGNLRRERMIPSASRATIIASAVWTSVP
ncbi:hypothetical protein D3C78_1164450 [compost metagenome]